MSTDIFGGVATLIAGLIAWLIYLRSKRDRKIEAANILLNEIYIAEREIDNIKQNKVISDYTSILPSNHWSEYQHLFIRNFNSNELRKISDFFKSSYLAEESVKQLRSFLSIATSQKAVSVQNKLLDLAEKYPDQKEYEKQKEGILKIFHSESYWFEPHATKEKLFDYIKNINQISLTSIGTKLEAVRNASWYQIII